jgi:hypothetical protein
VHEFDEPVPISHPNASTKELMTMLFGPAPIPDPEAKPICTKKL